MARPATIESYASERCPTCKRRRDDAIHRKDNRNAEAHAFGQTGAGNG